MIARPRRRPNHTPPKGTRFAWAHAIDSQLLSRSAALLLRWTPHHQPSSVPKWA